MVRIKDHTLKMPFSGKGNFKYLVIKNQYMTMVINQAEIKRILPSVLIKDWSYDFG